ncbi:MAG: hypothetical protein K6F87_03305 [Lachnospiraceae bacterium]|nr:hypothetical protein [Lachnospiraceae bacterium]
MKKIILTILTAAALAFAVIACKNVFSCRIPVGERGIADLEAHGDLELLFVGSSTFRSNLDIDLLDEDFDDSAYILAYGGNQYVACDIQYDEIKNRGGHKYDLLVLELDPLLLCEEVKLSDSRVIWDLSWDGKKRLWKSMSEGADVDFPLFYEYFVTSGIDDLVTYPVTEPFYATRYKKGAKTDEAASPGADVLENEKFDISSIAPVAAQEEALVSLIEKCKEDGQPFVLLECPHYHRLQDDLAYRKNLKYLTDLVKRTGADMITAETVGFDNTNSEYYEDMSHLSKAGRKEYTKALIPYLKALTSKTR